MSNNHGRLQCEPYGAHNAPAFLPPTAKNPGKSRHRGRTTAFHIFHLTGVKVRAAGGLAAITFSGNFCRPATIDEDGSKHFIGCQALSSFYSLTASFKQQLASW